MRVISYSFNAKNRYLKISQNERPYETNLFLHHITSDIMHSQQIEIPLSKKKMIASFIGALVFVILGAGLIIYPRYVDVDISPIILSITGLISILFFGLVAITLFRKLFDKKAGLIINKQGIIDNAGGTSAGTIAWDNIIEIKISKVMSQKFLMIIVNNPQDYIDMETNIIKKQAMKLNYTNYGSPITIASNTLKINFDNLNSLLQQKLKEHKENKTVGI